MTEERERVESRALNLLIFGIVAARLRAIIGICPNPFKRYPSVARAERDLMNATIRKFGYPDSCVKELARWVVLLRPQQVTLGSLVLACKEPATAFSETSPEAMVELHQAIVQVERALRAAFAYDKINYLMLMMVDPDVHFHVLPRYASERVFQDQTFSDYAWPRPPDLSRVNQADETTTRALRAHLQSFF